ncbi:MAG: DinB family protein [Gemmatimonadota bacterium]
MTGARFLPEFDDEMAKTRTTLEHIPADRLDFRPHEKSYSLGELGAHISSVPSWLTAVLSTMEFDVAAPAERNGPDTAAGIVAAFDENISAARDMLAAATDEDLNVAWTLRSGDQVIFNLPRVAVIRIMVLNHMIHHRGQLTVYLRMLDVPVPALYGPSADEG